MPSVSSKLQLTSGAISANTALADVLRIKGAFKTYASASLMNATSVNYFSDGQLVYVQDSGSLYKCNVSLADYEETFNDTVTFSEFSFNSGSFMSASFDGTHTLTLFGQNVSGSTYTSMSVDLSALTGSGGGGGGGATWIGDLLDVYTGSLDDGDVLAWNQSNARWEPTNVSGTGDISAVFAGDGLSGGGTQGSVSLDVNAGDGIVLTSSGVNVHTGSNHFIGGVQKVDIDGETF